MIAPANTGSVRRRRTTVIIIDQTNRGIRSSRIPFQRILTIVVIKLIDARIDEAPARCKEKIAKSTDGPEWARFPDSGGYTVQPVPAPDSMAVDETHRISDGGINQKLKLFIRGNAMSGAPNIRGISQFPNPPIQMGITIKKIIRNAWAVTRTLYNWSLPKNDPGWASSRRISILVPRPTIPLHIP